MSSAQRPKRIVVCTHNTHKLEEIGAMLQDLSIEVLSPKDFPGLPEPEETGDTFLANALIKADSALAFTGLPALADDSGLVVPSLNGDPGVHSARYAGETGATKDKANRDKLVEVLKGNPALDRSAHFHCSLVLRLSSDHYEHFEGQCHGEIIHEERGEHGFGYDPIFFYPPEQRTLAELPPHIKNTISHRAHAIVQLRHWLKNA